MEIPVYLILKILLNSQNIITAGINAVRCSYWQFFVWPIGVSDVQISAMNVVQKFVLVM